MNSSVGRFFRLLRNGGPGVGLGQLHRLPLEVLERLLQLEVVGAAVFERLAVAFCRQQPHLFFDFVVAGLGVFLVAVVGQVLFQIGFAHAQALERIAIGILVATPSLKVNSLEDFVKIANARKGDLNYGSSGIGSASHLQSEYLKSLTGMEMTHIPFKADAEIMQGIGAGQIHFGMSPVQGAMSSIKAGRCIPLAVTSNTRIRELPDVPTLKELTSLGTASIGAYTYYALFAPTGLDQRIVEQLNKAINAVSNSKEATVQLRNQLYFEPETGTPVGLKKYIEKDIEKWGKLSDKIDFS